VNLPARAGPNDYHGGSSLSLFVDAGGAANKYPDTPASSSWKPRQGVFVTAEKSIFADLPWKLSDAKDAKLDGVLER
jgi:hypothetical protein